MGAVPGEPGLWPELQAPDAGTLPAARRRGLALTVTAALVADARSRGAATVFLSAGDNDVAQIYARLGFRTVGTALIAEPAEWVPSVRPGRRPLPGGAREFLAAASTGA
ncbi:GNAT family N-acetyltransferase [Streptomyces sp. NPDC056296]|uniref:GNAT family N-acetyltransferase n=1 Tax=Streptomyces sp. NPDC056296 TaxID=3345775 RepID=UPI0035DF0B98